MKKTLCMLLAFTIVIASTVMAFSRTQGDVNSDGTINSSDALFILKYAVGSIPATFNSDVADMNNDGKINSSDALIVLMISVGIFPQPPSEENTQKPDTDEPLTYNKSQLINYYNTCLKSSYSQNMDAIKVEQVDVQVSGIDVGIAAINADQFANAIIANNTKNNGVIQEKSFVDGKATDDDSPVENFIAPANLYDEAVRSINIRKSGTGYQIIIVLNSESCAHTETAEYNASCSWPLDINVIDFGQAVTIKECTFNYPGTKITATVDDQGRVTDLKTEMPLSVTNARATAVGVNITVGSIDGKWTCVNKMKFMAGSSNSGGSNSKPNTKPNTENNEIINNNKPVVTLQDTIESLQKFTNEVKWAIDEDGNINVESTEGKDTGLFGFKYSTKDKCFITAEDAWQRQYGYNEIYDESAPVLAITYDTIRVYFDYDGLQWMIQYWKGQYGLVLVGAEIGIYNRPASSTPSTHYNCADDETKLLQSMNVYRCETSSSNEFSLIFSRSPSYTWWCTGFVPGTLAFAKYNVDADYTNRLRVDSKLTLKTPEMAQAFIEGLKNVTTIYNNAADGTTRPISFVEMSSVEEYETKAAKAKFVLEEDGVTVRVCWN